MLQAGVFDNGFGEKGLAIYTEKIQATITGKFTPEEINAGDIWAAICDSCTAINQHQFMVDALNTVVAAKTKDEIETAKFAAQAALDSLKPPPMPTGYEG